MQQDKKISHHRLWEHDKQEVGVESITNFLKTACQAASHKRALELLSRRPDVSHNVSLKVPQKEVLTELGSNTRQQLAREVPICGCVTSVGT